MTVLRYACFHIYRVCKIRYFSYVYYNQTRIKIILKNLNIFPLQTCFHCAQKLLLDKKNAVYVSCYCVFIHDTNQKSEIQHKCVAYTLSNTHFQFYLLSRCILFFPPTFPFLLFLAFLSLLLMSCLSF